jgi:hypothetical protein
MRVLTESTCASRRICDGGLWELCGDVPEAYSDARASQRTSRHSRNGCSDNSGTAGRQRWRASTPVWDPQIGQQTPPARNASTGSRETMLPVPGGVLTRRRWSLGLTARASAPWMSPSVNVADQRTTSSRVGCVVAGRGAQELEILVSWDELKPRFPVAVRARLA